MSKHFGNCGDQKPPAEPDSMWAAICLDQLGEISHQQRSWSYMELQASSPLLILSLCPSCSPTETGTASAPPPFNPPAVTATPHDAVRLSLSPAAAVLQAPEELGWEEGRRVRRKRADSLNNLKGAQIRSRESEELGVEGDRDGREKHRVWGNVTEKDRAAPSGEWLRGPRREGGFWDCVLASVSEGDLSTCPSSHSYTFLGSHGQSVVRGPGTDLGSACQQQIALIETARNPYSLIQEDARKPRL
ncbi:unnamed protein product [Pleuronectes platessa]|uniref:Uncharacterized protein n=1 Tax=Pleuronectes platessa TaxID=8262 RepID=A0A9N7ZBU1_PLEPL|nr:unnamed protein product [Pleuronectes platessa]